MEEKQYYTTNLFATTVGADDFSDLVNELEVKAQIREVDSSSLFCEIHIEEQLLENLREKKT